ncbi:MAG TPA: diguanylate cyclase, partial [Burkholderiales bacterium]|nr:diguanylate cyclase [Burkholderiales bacterium]
MMGMMACSAVSWYAYFPAFKAYFLPVALLTLARFTQEILSGIDREFFATLGAMFMIFSAALYILARQSNQALSQLLFLKSEKEESDARFRELSDRARRKERFLGLTDLVFSSSSEGIMVTDADRRIVEVNPAFTRITGYAPDEVVGNCFPLRQTMTQGSEFFSRIWHAVQDEGHWDGEIWNCRKNGEIYVQRTHIGLSRHPEGDRYVLQFSDVTEGKKKDELIWLQANFDMLTNLPNRRLLLERLEEAIEDCERFSLLLIDMDRFKEINETLGHGMGDLLLLETAIRIGRCMNDAGTLARVGGDEFMLILQHNPTRVAEKILEEIRKPIMLGEEVVQVSASMGITFYPDDAVHAEGLLKNAEQAMYCAKGKGGDGFE